jgi:pilus assembly protein CpaE
VPVQVIIIGSGDRKLEELVRASGLRPSVASAVDLLALTHPSAAQPDVLMVDIRGHGQVPSALAALKRQHPATSVVLVATELTPGLMLEAMRAGANECVAEPLNGETIGSAISRLIAQRSGPIGGQVFAFVGAKGGVGTTTLAVNVATALAQTHGSTLFIDLHPAYGDARVLFGAEPRFSLMDALENTHRLDLSFFQGLTAQTKAGVTLLASPDNGSIGAVDVHRIRLLLDFAARNYRYTVLDLPRSNPVMLDALETATGIFVVASQELASVRGASRVTDALSRRYTRDKVSAVVSRYDKGAEIVTRDIEDVLNVPVRCTFPSDYRLALQALNEGRPFVLAGNSKLAAAVTAFARQLTGASLAVAAAATPSSSVGPLRSWLGTLGWTTSA